MSIATQFWNRPWVKTFSRPANITYIIISGVSLRVPLRPFPLRYTEQLSLLQLLYVKTQSKTCSIVVAEYAAENIELLFERN